MVDQDDILSLEEVGRILSRLRQPDLLRLAALARTWVRGLERREAADLLNEALARILSGQRPWPADVPLPAFLSQVMRSIASQWRHEDAREQLADDGDAPREPSTPMADVEFAHLVGKMRAALENDPSAQGVFDHILSQTNREQARSLLGLDITAYDTTRRRMIRILHRQFKPGWTL
jgi:DNA-directed RNA polymerase specialized sigma24 family protein